MDIYVTSPPTNGCGQNMVKSYAAFSNTKPSSNRLLILKGSRFLKMPQWTPIFCSAVKLQTRKPHPHSRPVIPIPTLVIPAPTPVIPAPTLVIPAPTPVIPAPTPVIPAKAGIQRLTRQPVFNIKNNYPTSTTHYLIWRLATYQPMLTPCRHPKF